MLISIGIEKQERNLTNKFQLKIKAMESWNCSLYFNLVKTVNRYIFQTYFLWANCTWTIEHLENTCVDCEIKFECVISK